jgi:epsin
MPAAVSRPSYGGSSMGMTSGGGLGMGAPLMPSGTMAPTNLMQASQGGRATPTQGGRSTPSAGNATKSSTTFDDLWSTSLTSNTGRSTSASTGGSTAGKSIMDLQKEKAQTAFWGTQNTQAKPSGGMNSFGGTSTTAPASGGGGGLDDLLL